MSLGIYIHVNRSCTSAHTALVGTPCIMPPDAPVCVPHAACEYQVHRAVCLSWLRVALTAQCSMQVQGRGGCFKYFEVETGLTVKLYRPKPIISVDWSLEICLWKVAGMLKFALRPESIEVSHSVVLVCYLQVARLFVSNFGFTEVVPNWNARWSAHQVHPEF